MTAIIAKPTSEPKKVKVRYVPSEFGISLRIEDRFESRAQDVPTQPVRTPESAAAMDGVIRITDLLVTLEIRRGDGQVSTMMWEPADVPWESVS